MRHCLVPANIPDPSWQSWAGQGQGELAGGSGMTRKKKHRGAGLWIGGWRQGWTQTLRPSILWMGTGRGHFWRAQQRENSPVVPVPPAEASWCAGFLGEQPWRDTVLRPLTVRSKSCLVAGHALPQAEMLRNKSLLLYCLECGFW